MYAQSARHPRAGAALGAAILAAWVGALGVAMAADGSKDGSRRAAPAAKAVETPSARPGRAGPGYVRVAWEK
jgi:hypothetical protein